MRLLEIGQSRQQPFCSERSQCRDRQHLIVVLAFETIGSEPQVVECRSNARKVFPRLSRQRQAAVLPDEQLDPKLLFEPPDLMADRRLRDVQLGGSQREAEVSGGGFEGAQAIKGGQASSHGLIPSHDFLSSEQVQSVVCRYSETPQYLAQQVSFRRQRCPPAPLRI